MKPYYEDDSCTIYHGDCRDVITQLQGIDVVITDPPYGVGLSAKRAKQRGGEVLARIGSYGVPDTPAYVEEIVVPIIEMCRALYPAVVLTPGTRNLWLYPPAADVGCLYSAAGTGMGRWGFTCMQPILYYGKDPYLAHGMGSRPNSRGQTYPNDANAQNHPCAKPIRMWTWLVNRASLPTQTVLDPFMGSGTTLLAAKNLGRKAIGIEVEEAYCQIAAERLSQEVLPLDLEQVEQRHSILQSSLLSNMTAATDGKEV